MVVVFRTLLRMFCRRFFTAVLSCSFMVSPLLRFSSEYIATLTYWP